MITFLHEKRRQVRQCNQQLTKSKPCAAGSSIRWGDPQPQHQGPLAIASRSNLSLLPARPASEQIFRSVIEHALRVIFRKLDHVHHDVRVIDIFQWLLEATRASSRMNDDVPAEAMLQKTPCGHARHEENRWWKRCRTHLFCAGIPFQRNPVVRAPKLHRHFLAWKYLWIKPIAPVAVDIFGVIPRNPPRANRVQRLPIQENLKFHVVTDQSHAYTISSYARRDR